MNIEWNADNYTNNFSFVHEYGNSVIELIENKGSSTVLDLGCGNGALTNKLTELGFSACGLDASSELLNTARQSYPELTFYEGDATNFNIKQKVDVVFSNAVFHWIERDKQLDMLKCVYDTLNDGGQFVFEFGGHGNNERILGALEDQFEQRDYKFNRTFYFPTIGEYSGLLEKSGFEVTYAIKFNRLTELKGENGVADWINMFVQTPFKGYEADKEEIINDAVESLRNELLIDGKWYADYVRLRMKAIKKFTE